MKFCGLTMALLLINSEASALPTKLTKQLNKVSSKTVKSNSEEGTLGNRILEKIKSQKASSPDSQDLVKVNEDYYNPYDSYSNYNWNAYNSWGGPNRENYWQSWGNYNGPPGNYYWDNNYNSYSSYDYNPYDNNPYSGYNYLETDESEANDADAGGDYAGYDYE